MSNACKNTYTVDNSYSFVSEISKFNNVNNYFMASFDIDNLFTNVPLSETIDIVVSRLFSNNDSFLSFSRILFRKLLELAVTNSFFTFNEQLYRQKEGLGMGLPLSPVMANIFLDFHEEKWMSDCPSEFAPIFYRRYVDDCFLIFNEKDHAPLFLDYLNSKHQNINFTMETESNNQISFLDVLVRKDDFNFNTTVFRKPTFSGLGVSYFSYCCRKFKLNSIKSLVSRAYMAFVRPSIISTTNSFI